MKAKPIRKSKKSELLKIMKDILTEYKEVRHEVDITKCGLCVKYMDEDSYTSCDRCPMMVFDGYTSYPCMSRKCEPVGCRFISPDDIDLLRVTKFYELAITKIESMSVDAVRKSSFRFLIKIDKEVKI